MSYMTRAELGIKINPKQNVVSGFKFLSRDSLSLIPYAIHICIMTTR